MPRRAGQLLAAAVLILAGGALPAPAEDAPLANVSGQAITQKDVDAAVKQYYHAAALDHLILQALLDATAKKVGVSVSDQQVDTTIANWKLAEYGGDDSEYAAALARQGLTPALYREVVRQGMLADAIAAKTTRLEDSDYDQVDAERIWTQTPAEASTIYAALHGGRNLTEVAKLGIPTEILGTTTFLRYDQRLDEPSRRRLFQAAVGHPIPPVPCADPAGSMVVIVTAHRPGARLSGPDRKIWTDFLLKEKIGVVAQDWWTELEKRAATIRAAASSAGAPPIGAAPAPSVAAPTGTSGVNTSTVVPESSGTAH